MYLKIEVYNNKHKYYYIQNMTSIYIKDQFSYDEWDNKRDTGIYIICTREFIAMVIFFNETIAIKMFESSFRVLILFIIKYITTKYYTQVGVFIGKNKYNNKSYSLKMK